ncbi:hypothetical protein BT93_L5091 [Corymbia citriodora subsp. variegata]|uniref:MD-2-related lipid-recognition domain-containing protein n=1 Tax=Corymbia citriodora subsp. variegata TaxID=360336 RepID=A0A8T0CFA9_CORYI|nr:hypothetical protein BT93_L5091 [Corymbia citriodora subsp. variegata]
MKLITVLAPLIATGAALSIQTPLLAVDDKLAVPGNNTLYFCSDPSNYTLNVTRIDFDPRSPKKGETLHVETQGILRHPIVDGAKVQLTVKLQIGSALIPVYHQTIDVCEGEDDECPIKKGSITLTKDVELPGAIPNGKYAVNIDAKNGDDEESELLCLNTVLTFG